MVIDKARQLFLLLLMGKAGNGVPEAFAATECCLVVRHVRYRLADLGRVIDGLLTIQLPVNDIACKYQPRHEI